MEGTMAAQDAPDHAKQQSKAHRVKNCLSNRYANLSYQADNPWHLDAPAPNIGLGNGTLQQTSPLLILPPEIKNMIYKFALDRDCTANEKGYINVSSAAASRQCQCDDCDRTQDSLLLTCRDAYRVAVGMSFSSEHPFRFEGSETILKFLNQMSPRRQQGIRHVVLALIKPTDSLEDLITILQALRRLPRLVRLEVEIHFDKVFRSPKERYLPQCELEKMVGLEYFSIQISHDRAFARNYSLRRAVIRIVKNMCRAVPSMRNVDPEVRSILIGDSDKRVNRVPV